MTAEEYRTALKEVLKSHEPLALEQLRAIKKHLPEKAAQLIVGIHPGQSEEGFFDVMVHLEGPDRYVLNKHIEVYRSLFAVQCIDGNMKPDVPMFSQASTGFSVNDMIVDTCMDWIENLWAKFGGVGIPAMIFAEDGYGSVDSKPLLTPVD